MNMKIDKNYLIGIGAIVIGIIGFPLWYIAHLATRDATLSRKINSSLDLLPNCGFESLRKEQVELVLLQAKKALDIDGNYGEAADLVNSIGGDLFACTPTLQANPDLMLLTVLALMIGFGIIILVSRYRETRTKGKRESS